MDQADIELRTTIIKCWPHTKRDKIDLLVPTPKGKHQKIGNKSFVFPLYSKYVDVYI